MSLSNPRKTNPAKFFLEFKGGTEANYWQYYDKIQEKNIIIEGPFFVVVLDQLATITGYNENAKAGFYANEIRNTKNDILNVKVRGNGVFCSGLWSKISDKVKAAGGKFTASVYAVWLHLPKNKGDEIETTLINLQISGAAVGAWFDAKISTDDGRIIEIDSGQKPVKKGKVEYYLPIIKKKAIRPDLVKKCIDLDIELQKYLTWYFNQDIEEVAVNEIEMSGEVEMIPEKIKEENIDADPFDSLGDDHEDDLPF